MSLRYSEMKVVGTLTVSATRNSTSTYTLGEDKYQVPDNSNIVWSVIELGDDVDLTFTSLRSPESYQSTYATEYPRTYPTEDEVAICALPGLHYLEWSTNYNRSPVMQSANNEDHQLRGSFAEGVSIDANGRGDDGNLYFTTFVHGYILPGNVIFNDGEDTPPTTSIGYPIHFPAYEQVFQAYGRTMEEIEPPPPDDDDDDDEDPPPPDDDDDDDDDDDEDPPPPPPPPVKPPPPNPKQTQLVVVVNDLTSQGLYGILKGPEYESDYIETVRQATRVGEQIIFQANQVISISFTIPYDPRVKRGKTIRVQTLLSGGFTFHGLVKAVGHTFDSNSGQVITQISARCLEYKFASSLTTFDINERLDQRQA